MLRKDIRQWILVYNRIMVNVNIRRFIVAQEYSGVISMLPEDSESKINVLL